MKEQNILKENGIWTHLTDRIVSYIIVEVVGIYGERKVIKMTQDVINKLREYGGYSKNGKMSDRVIVQKELLNEAADLLEMYIMFECKITPP